MLINFFNLLSLIIVSLVYIFTNSMNISSYPSQYPSTLPIFIVSSLSPTIKLSNYPSLSLSRTPSYLPTNKLSDFPTILPSKFPTYTPSRRPSISPTIAPMKNPSKSPSTKPTQAPSLLPSSRPSRSPSIKPTHAPSLRLSFRPSSSPSYSVQKLSQCLQQYSPGVKILNKNLANQVYISESLGWNARFDYIFPRLIVDVVSIDDIRASILCSKASGVAIEVMNGGHSFEGLSCTTGLLLHMDNYNSVISSSFSTTNGTITIQSGMRLGKLYGSIILHTKLQHSYISRNTYVVSAGTGATVGVTGHAICGGYGFLGRQLGFLSDQILSAQILIANGTLVTANFSHHSDLFWALRGSCSSSFGIVTSLTFRLTMLNRLHPNLTVIALPAIPLSKATPFLVWWQSWATQASSSLTSVILLQGSNIFVQAIFIGSRSQAMSSTYSALATATKGLLSLTVLQKSYKEMSYLDTVIWWTGDSAIRTLSSLLAIKSLPTWNNRGSRRKVKSALVSTPLSTAAMSTLVSFLKSGDLNGIVFKAYGGAYAANGTFYTDNRSPLLRGHIYEIHYSGSQDKPGGDYATVQRVQMVGSKISALLRGSTKGYPGYIDTNLVKAGENYFGIQNAKMLSSIRRMYDPTGVFYNRATRLLYP